METGDNYSVNALVAFIKDLLTKCKLTISIPLGTFSKKNKQEETSVRASGNIELPNTNISLTTDISLQKPDKPDSSLNITPRHQFIIKLKQVAASIHQTFGIDALIAITQSAHESRWGMSELTVEANNLFGKTAGSWYQQRRPVVWMPTWEYSPLPPEKIKYWEYADDIIEKKPDGKGGTNLKVNRPFRKYASWEHSLQDWALGLANRASYKDAYDASKIGDIHAFAKAVFAAGYATDKNYEKKLLEVYDVVVKLSKEITNVA